MQHHTEKKKRELVETRAAVLDSPGSLLKKEASTTRTWKLHSAWLSATSSEISPVGEPVAILIRKTLLGRKGEIVILN